MPVFSVSRLSGLGGVGARLRVAVVGLDCGRTHIEGWRQHPQVDVAVIADPDERRLDAVGERYGIATRYTCARQMLAVESFDVVSICAPSGCHTPLALQAFEAGSHVLCEAPLALNAEEGRTLLAAAQRAGRRLMVHSPCRFSAQSRALKAHIDSGRLGGIRLGRTVWRLRRDTAACQAWFDADAQARGWPLIDLGAQHLDQALWLMGRPKPTWVLGGAHEPIVDRRAEEAGAALAMQDRVSALIRFDNGATLAVDASWATETRIETHLLGTKADLLQTHFGEDQPFEACVINDSSGLPFDALRRSPRMPARSGMHQFAEAILHDQAQTPGGGDGLVLRQILDAIRASARSGDPVRL